MTKTKILQEELGYKPYNTLRDNNIAQKLLRLNILAAMHEPSDEEQYVASCYHGQHYQQAREPWQQDTPAPRPDILEREKKNKMTHVIKARYPYLGYQLQHDERSYPSSTNDGHSPQETGGQLGQRLRF